MFDTRCEQIGGPQPRAPSRFLPLGTAKPLNKPGILHKSPILASSGVIFQACLPFPCLNSLPNPPRSDDSKSYNVLAGQVFNLVSRPQISFNLSNLFFQPSFTFRQLACPGH